LLNITVLSKFSLHKKQLPVILSAKKISFSGGYASSYQYLPFCGKMLGRNVVLDAKYRYLSGTCAVFYYFLRNFYIFFHIIGIQRVYYRQIS